VGCVGAMASVEEYIAAGAVLPVDGLSVAPSTGKSVGLSVDGATDKPVSKRKEPRRRRLARKSQWLRSGGRYLDIGQYYISEPKPCSLAWVYEQKGEGEGYRYRAIGCGDRIWCQSCCCYHRDRLAADAAADMLAAIEGLEIAVDVSPRDFGTTVIPTIPKETSLGRCLG